MIQYPTTTTLNIIRAARPCEGGWTTLLKGLSKTSGDDEPLPLLTILDINGLDDALWCIDADPALERLKPYLLARDPSGLRFFMSNAQKDLGYYATMAEDGGAAHAIADGVLATYERAVQQGGAQALVPELVSLLAQGGAR